MKYKIENIVPMDGTYLVQKHIPASSGFGKIVEMPMKKVKEIQKAQKEFYKHQSYLRGIYRDLGR